MQHFSSDLIDCQLTVNIVFSVLAVMFHNVLDPLNFMNLNQNNIFDKAKLVDLPLRIMGK